MKKVVLVFLLLFVAVLGLAQLKVVILINGTLGDKSFFDSAARGAQMITKELGVPVRVIEMGYNPVEWEPTLEDISDSGEYELVIVGTWQMVDVLARVAPMYPDIKYVIFDTDMDYSTGKLENVYSITYKQNEGSFLAGALAALVSTSGKLPYALPDKKVIGLLGGMDIPVINDFLIGYIEGALYIDTAMKVALSYVGSWNDPAKGKEFTLSMYRQSADVVFAVAGETGNGVLEAAKEANRWGIGVDSDMQLIYESKDSGIVNHTLTSMLKNVDYSLLRAVSLYLENKLIFGRNEALGLKEGSVGLAYNKYYEAVLEKDPVMKDRLAQIEKDIIEGKIIVGTAIGMSNEELDKIRNSVKP
jgi:basic membrane protein A